MQSASAPWMAGRAPGVCQTSPLLLRSRLLSTKQQRIRVLRGNAWQRRYRDSQNSLANPSPPSWMALQRPLTRAEICRQSEQSSSRDDDDSPGSRTLQEDTDEGTNSPCWDLAASSLPSFLPACLPACLPSFLPSFPSLLPPSLPPSFLPSFLPSFITRALSAPPLHPHTAAP